ncbi:MAG TPA: DUF1015 domain-containing protein [Syntrophomonadaceae bacterium]|nr:DUF1015 domain-containing protein [Syntrophomonadaceae bacterium]
MATITAFKGLRYNTEKVSNLTAVVTPPYDIIDDAAQAKYYAQHPANIIRLELGMIFPKDTAANNRYTRAAQYLEKWLEDEILLQEIKPALYLYQQEFVNGDKKFVRTGFICGLKVEDYQTGNVLPHEETLSKPKADRLQLMKATHSNFSSIFGLYSDPEHSIDKLLLTQTATCQPDIDIIDENNESHKIWAVTDEAIIKQVVDFIAGKKIFIADGHHRYETALEYARQMKEQGYKGYDYVMTTLVNLYDEGLVVLPTHRVAAGLGKLSMTTLKKQLAPLFDIKSLGHKDALNILEQEMADAPRDKHMFGMYTFNGELLLLTLKDTKEAARLLPAEKSTAWKDLDVAILDNIILDQTLGIDEVARRNQENLAYTHSQEWVIEQVDNKNYQLGFIINPTRVQQVVDVAEAHDKMPQKSTYFYPKLITGLIINDLEAK